MTGVSRWPGTCPCGTRHREGVTDKPSKAVGMPAPSPGGALRPRQQQQLEPSSDAPRSRPLPCALPGSPAQHPAVPRDKPSSISNNPGALEDTRTETFFKELRGIVMASSLGNVPPGLPGRGWRDPL
uniref:Uncharacterized protein n=1 Tax=Molossus molossus TaxID=27622 RepID=A0A7J8F994_MOLMO|nr:hypothetical protein HJG59_008599 [Molossus molossus]